MDDILQQIAYCIEFGKVNLDSLYPPDMKGREGAYELTRKALEQGISPEEILQKGFIEAMQKVGQRFSEQKIFIPQMLMSAKAMTTSMEHLKPYFKSGAISRKGKFLIGTVTGDLHDIGKNLVAMMVEGAGWEVIDMGVDLSLEKLETEVQKHPGCIVGLSALLTTTMINMERMVKVLKDKFPGIIICIGGAPVNSNYCTKINADFYAPNPQGLIDFLNQRLIA